MRINELRQEIDRVKTKHEMFVESLRGEDNLQTNECYLYHSHIVETLDAVLARIEGDRIALDLL